MCVEFLVFYTDGFYVDVKVSLDLELQTSSIFSIGTRYKNCETFDISPFSLNSKTSKKVSESRFNAGIDNGGDLLVIYRDIQIEKNDQNYAVQENAHIKLKEAFYFLPPNNSKICRSSLFEILATIKPVSLSLKIFVTK